MPITLGSPGAPPESPSQARSPEDAPDSPKRRDPEATRRAILDAAENLFADFGPAATSLARVAKTAGITKSLIHHHFGSKEELWHEVQGRYFQEYFENQKAMIEGSESTADLLRDSLVAYFEFLRLNPKSVKFLAWSFAISDENHCPTGEEEELFELGIEKIKESQAKGEIRDDLEPFFIIKTLIALPFQWFLTRQDTLSLIDDSVEGTRLDEMYLHDTIELFLHGVRPRGAS
ncbi:MAG: TetR/AcrR family transcriptional regulator [Acidobacteriota bacterium]